MLNSVTVIHASQEGHAMPDITIDSRFAGKTATPDRPPAISGVIVARITENADDRQVLSVFLKATDPFFSGFQQSYVTKTSRGVVKAWHYHLKQTDVWFVASGKIKVGLFDAREGSPTCGVANTVVMGTGANVTLVIPPGVFHGYITLSEESVLINTTNCPYSPDDEFRAPWDDPQFGFTWEVENR
jgi:dTDP-4-dehydrorhamnose 3,5-epimerase